MQRDVLDSLLRATGDVGVALDLARAGIKVDWQHVMLVSLPEYYRASPPPNYFGVILDEGERWKSLTLWLTFFNRRILKTLVDESDRYELVYKDGDDGTYLRHARAA